MEGHGNHGERLLCNRRCHRVCSALFWTTAALFWLAALILATVIQAPGSNDSMSNLDTARNLAAGRGFQSNMVQQLFQWQPLPNPETVRFPGIPYLMAGLFRVFGVSLKVQVLVNAVTVFASAWLLRWTLQRAGAAWFAGLGGALMLLSANYEMHSIWSNNLLVLCTIGLLAVATTRDTLSPGQGTGGELSRSWRSGNGTVPLPNATVVAWPILGPWRAAAISGAIGAIGFLTKPTFILTAVPLAGFLLLADGRERPASRRIRLVSFLWFALVLAILTSPYWVRNMVLFGRPLYSSSMVSRLSIRYETAPYGYSYTFRWDQPESYREVVEQLGWGGLLTQELRLWWKTFETIGRLNYFLAALGVASLIGLWRHCGWWNCAPPVLAMAEPLFTTGVYHHVEFRYLWPVYPAGLCLIGLAVRDFPSWSNLAATAAARWAFGFRWLLMLGVVLGTWRAGEYWRRWFVAAREPPPSWVAVVKSSPADAVVLTDDPYSVAWHAERKAVVCPGGPREHLLRVIDAYRPSYFLQSGCEGNRRMYKQLALQPGDLEPLADGLAPDGRSVWEFSHLSLQRGNKQR